MLTAKQIIAGCIDFDAYRALPGVNWSLLREMDKSPAHYAYRREHEKPDSARLLFGRAVHTAVLEPDDLPLQYAVYEGKTRRGKEWDAFVESNPGKSILKPDEYRTCLAVRDAVLANPDAAALLTGTSEVAVQWEDAKTGIACKGRVDHVLGDGFIDLKTTTNIDAWAFTNVSAKMHYHAAAAFYARGLDAASACLIAVEVNAPYDVGVFRFTDDALLAGAQKVDDLLAHLATCLERDEWPGRYSGEQDLNVPEWMVDPDEDSWEALNR